MCYTRNQLLELKVPVHTKLSQDVWANIISLGLRAKPPIRGAGDQEGFILENEQLHDQPTTNNCNNIPRTVTANRPILERKKSC